MKCSCMKVLKIGMVGNFHLRVNFLTIYLSIFSQMSTDFKNWKNNYNSNKSWMPFNNIILFFIIFLNLQLTFKKINRFLRCGLFFHLEIVIISNFPPFFECFTYARVFGSQSKLTVLIAFAKIWHMSKHFIVKSNQMNVLGHTV